MTGMPSCVQVESNNQQVLRKTDVVESLVKKEK